MEYKFGQTIHVGAGYSGVIGHINDTQVTTFESNGNFRVHYKEDLDRMIWTGLAQLDEGIPEHMEDAFEKALEANALVRIYSEHLNS